MSKSKKTPPMPPAFMKKTEKSEKMKEKPAGKKMMHRKRAY